MIRAASLPAAAASRRGAVAVEFAVVVPFLVLLATGAFEIGRGILVRQVLTDAVRKACRTGALPNRASSDITSDANDILSDNSLPTIDNNHPTTAASITILVNGQAVDASTANQGDQISVKVSVPFNKVSWTPLFFFNNTTIESETLVMMRQG